MKQGINYNESKCPAINALLPSDLVDQAVPMSNGRSNPEVVGSIPTEVKRIFPLPRVVP